MNETAMPAPIAPGFARPSWDSQAVFRRVLETMSYPGRIAAVDVDLEPPAPLHPATAAVCLTLLDYETPLWLQSRADHHDVEAYLRFHCGCPLTDSAESADFALILHPGRAPGLETFGPGQAEQPHRSTTLLLQVDSLTGGPRARLQGPGIADRAELAPAGLAAGFWEQWRRNASRYPLGIDVTFASGSRVAALPRTVQVES